MADIVIVRTGAANLASVVAALRRCGASAAVSDDAAEVENALALVLPGVGAFGPAMDRLRERRLERPLIERLRAADRPTLAICLGLQLLFDSSAESPGARGLGVIPGTVERFRGEVRVPQLGWNRVEPETGCGVPAGYAYFANSFRATAAPAGWAAAWADHGGPFIASLQRGRVLACQFHPELSGAWGLALMRSWLTDSAD